MKITPLRRRLALFSILIGMGISLSLFVIGYGLYLHQMITYREGLCKVLSSEVVLDENNRSYYGEALVFSVDHNCTKLFTHLCYHESDDRGGNTEYCMGINYPWRRFIRCYSSESDIELFLTDYSILLWLSFVIFLIWTTLSTVVLILMIRWGCFDKDAEYVPMS